MNEQSNWWHRVQGVNTNLTHAGAFPEVRQAQFPLGMGKTEKRSQGTLAVTLDADGQVNYDAVLKQSKLAERTVASSHSALVPKIDDIKNGVSFPCAMITPCSDHSTSSLSIRSSQLSPDCL